MYTNISILGTGWLGLPLGEFLVQQGYVVRGSRRSQHPPKTSFPLDQVCINAEVITGPFDEFLHQAEVLVITLPPPKSETPQRDYEQQMTRITERLPQHVRVIFTSSTSVYGNATGTINEQYEPKPSTHRAQAISAAEETLKKHLGPRLTILRLAGLIGPNRHPGKFLAGRSEIAAPNSPVNLVHQDDCIQAIQHVIQHNCFGHVFNVCANEHPTKQQFYTAASKALNLTLPTFSVMDNSQNKTIDNSKSKELLGITYKTLPF